MDNRFIQGLKINWERFEGESYITEIPALKNLSELMIQSNITFFVGENGTGKSTLLEAIAVAYGFNPEGGTKNFNFSTQDTHSSLSNAIVLLRGAIRPKDGYFLRTESFYNVASQIDSYERNDPGYLSYYGGKYIGMNSVALNL